MLPAYDPKQDKDDEILVTIKVRKSELSEYLAPEPEPEFKEGFLHHQIMWPDWADKNEPHRITWNILQCFLFLHSLGWYVIDLIPLLIVPWLFF